MSQAELGSPSAYPLPQGTGRTVLACRTRRALRKEKRKKSSELALSQKQDGEEGKEEDPVPREEHPEGWEDPRTREMRSNGCGREDRLGSPHPSVPKAVGSVWSQTLQGVLVDMSPPRAMVRG